MSAAFFEFFERTASGSVWVSRQVCRAVQNSSGVLAFTALLLMPARKTKGWSPFRLRPTPNQVKGHICPPIESTSSGDVDRVVIQPQPRDDIPDRFRSEKVHCLTVGGLVFRDHP